MAYVPPYKRVTTPPPPPQVAVVPVVVTQSHHAWLREQQARVATTIKTPEQRRAELATLTFQQLRSRAGPGPSVDGFDFWSQECEHTESSSSVYAAQLTFSSDLNNYRKNGSCPPPRPLNYTTTFADFVASGRPKAALYEEWYNQWGKLLRAKWGQERGLTDTNKKQQQRTTTVEAAPPNPTPARLIPLPTEKSGW